MDSFRWSVSPSVPLRPLQRQVTAQTTLYHIVNVKRLQSIGYILVYCDQCSVWCVSVNQRMFIIEMRPSGLFVLRTMFSLDQMPT